MLETADKSHVTILIMIDLSATFDTIDIPTLLEILHNYFAIQGIPLKSAESYLTNRDMKVIIEQSTSDTVHLRLGVP